MNTKKAPKKKKATRAKKILAALVIMPLVGLAALYGYIFYAGPHMKVQPHLRAFQRVLPFMPKDAVPVDPAVSLPSAARAAYLVNPLAPSPENIARGRTYYSYYCIFCHGEEGAGNGPVGESYMPKPADVRTYKVRNLSDGQLLRAMFVGIGHEPVLEQVVPPEHRWYVVLFVRALGSG